MRCAAEQDHSFLAGAMPCPTRQEAVATWHPTCTRIGAIYWKATTKLRVAIECGIQYGEGEEAHWYARDVMENLQEISATPINLASFLRGPDERQMMRLVYEQQPCLAGCKRLARWLTLHLADQDLASTDRTKRLIIICAMPLGRRTLRQLDLNNGSL